MPAGTVLNLEDVISPERRALEISNKFREWDQAKADIKRQWLELRNYLFATDTSTTSNSSLPWKNKTTMPKLTQIRDNLFANYMATLFPKRRWLKWDADSMESATKQKKDLLEAYAYYLVQHPEFKRTLESVLYDWIDTGNCFTIIDWRDENVETETTLKVGYSGPVPRRISPYDIVFNPTAPSFSDTPKIIRSLETIGDLERKAVEWSSDPYEKQVAQEALKYLKAIRTTAFGVETFKEKDEAYKVDGFESFHTYLLSDYVELLYFYGDIYDKETGKFQRNRKIVVADRHKLLLDVEDPSMFGKANIFHVGWRPRPDNLWSMGPLDNLVGMQYRLDHIENLKADVFDLIAFPVIKEKGYVESFEFKPGARIRCDSDGDVEFLAPDAQALNANLELAFLESKMEELAGAPKEAMGFRTPGEKTMYEVQRLENAASRTFQSKITTFEEQLIERLLNGMIGEARRMGVTTQVSMIDPEFGAKIWSSITPADLAGPGRLRPVAARHFAEKAQMVQNLNSFFSSPVGQDPAVKQHFSGLKTAQMFEELLEIKDYEIIEPYVAIAEATESQKLQAVGGEESFAVSQTPGAFDEPVSPGDFSTDA